MYDLLARVNMSMRNCSFVHGGIWYMPNRSWWIRAQVQDSWAKRLECPWWSDRVSGNARRAWGMEPILTTTTRQSVHRVLTALQKKQLCEVKEGSENMTQAKLIEYATHEFGITPSMSQINRMLQNKEQFLSIQNQEGSRIRDRGAKWSELEAAMAGWLIQVGFFLLRPADAESLSLGCRAYKLGDPLSAESAPRFRQFYKRKPLCCLECRACLARDLFKMPSIAATCKFAATLGQGR